MVIRSQQLSVWKYVAVAYNAIVARTVHRSLLAWLPTPSLTHVPPLVSWQYEDPLMICHMVPVTTSGSGDGGEGDGGGVGNGGDGNGGGVEGGDVEGGDGEGGRGVGGGGGPMMTAIVEAQIVKPP